MKKSFFLFVAILIVTFSLSAQKSQESALVLNKTNMQGYSLTLSNLSIDVVTTAFEEQFQKIIGKKPTKQNGYYLYSAQKFPAFGSELYDIYYKIEEAGKRDMKTTVISMIVCKGLNPITSTTDATTAVNIMNYLNNFPQYALEYDINQKIIAFNNKINKSNETRKGYIEKREKLQKEINELDLKIKEIDELIRKTEEELKTIKEKL